MTVPWCTLVFVLVVARRCECGPGSRRQPGIRLAVSRGNRRGSPSVESR